MSKYFFAKSFDLYNKTAGIIPGRSQTNSKRPEAYAPGGFPAYLCEGKGAHVRDIDGNEYIDYIAGIGPMTLGYGIESINRAMHERIDKGISLGLPSPLEFEAAERIRRFIPCAEMIRFFKTGSDATNAGARLARAYTGREKIAMCGYHGQADIWAASLPADGKGKGVPLVLKDHIRTFEHQKFDGENCLDAVLSKETGQFAAVTISLPYHLQTSKDFYVYLRETANKHNCILLFDEIVTGLRWARAGVQEYFGVIPDLACYAKGIANGAPISVLCGKADILKLMENMQLTSTYGGDTLSLAALIAVSDFYDTHNVIGKIWDNGRKLREGIDKILSKYKLPYKTAGYDCFPCIEGAALPVNALINQEMAKRGILFRGTGNKYIMYMLTDEDIQKTLKAASETFSVIVKIHDDEEKIKQAIQANGTEYEEIIRTHN